jgi:hypothetical protein
LGLGSAVEESWMELAPAPEEAWRVVGGALELASTVLVRAPKVDRRFPFRGSPPV